MSNQGASAREWLDASIIAAKELAQIALGLDGAELISIREGLPGESDSAYIALVGEKSSAQIGIASDAEGCQQIARTLLGMEPDEEDLSEEDVADAIGEIANILAGQIKTLMAEKSIDVVLGMPIFIQGRVKMTSDMEFAAADMHFGSIPVTVMILKDSKN
ncbi:MAG: chemotaxis protein CheX [Proteobacteria bacterium]|nr:chemotaxis protein CheX [Pseudomonadota bacterium]